MIYLSTADTAKKSTTAGYLLPAVLRNFVRAEKPAWCSSPS